MLPLVGGALLGEVCHQRWVALGIYSLVQLPAPATMPFLPLLTLVL